MFKGRNEVMCGCVNIPVTAVVDEVFCQVLTQPLGMYRLQILWQYFNVTILTVMFLNSNISITIKA
jgi:hypothetical protein